jgi:hypothetical protein
MSAWRPDSDTPALRKMVEADVVRKYALIGMTLTGISKFLGEPRSADEAKSNISYELNFPTCGEVARLFLQLELKQGHVWRYRLEEIDKNAPGNGISHSNWVNSNFTRPDSNAAS